MAEGSFLCPPPGQGGRGSPKTPAMPPSEHAASYPGVAAQGTRWPHAVAQPLQRGFGRRLVHPRQPGPCKPRIAGPSQPPARRAIIPEPGLGGTPTPRFGMADQSGTRRIALHVPHDHAKVFVPLHGKRREPPLIRVPSSARLLKDRQPADRPSEDVEDFSGRAKSPRPGERPKKKVLTPLVPLRSEGDPGALDCWGALRRTTGESPSSERGCKAPGLPAGRAV